uniref:Uncharacterized protein n=1 Tax=Mimiviridae sp. ChoanoV1 TaxID=2596887 RepID=A0A5B8IG34_9VIRU|nr:hypothetical protein 8_45 [Mimiviridae sp. ChoanoV1]
MSGQIFSFKNELNNLRIPRSRRNNSRRKYPSNRNQQVIKETLSKKKPSYRREPSPQRKQSYRREPSPQRKQSYRREPSPKRNTSPKKNSTTQFDPNEEVLDPELDTLVKRLCETKKNKTVYLIRIKKMLKKLKEEKKIELKKQKPYLVCNDSGDEKYFTNFEKAKVFMKNKNKIGSDGVWVVRNNSGRHVIIAR